MCPSLGIELVTLWFPGRHSVHRATAARAVYVFTAKAACAGQRQVQGGREGEGGARAVSPGRWPAFPLELCGHPRVRAFPQMEGMGWNGRATSAAGATAQSLTLCHDCRGSGSGNPTTTPKEKERESHLQLGLP